MSHSARLWGIIIGKKNVNQKLTVWRVFREEWAQDAALRRVTDRGIVERVDKSGNPEHVREEDKLLTDRCAHLARAGEKVDGAHPFVRGDAAEAT